MGGADHRSPFAAVAGRKLNGVALHRGLNKYFQPLHCPVGRMPDQHAGRLLPTLLGVAASYGITKDADIFFDQGSM